MNEDIDECTNFDELEDGKAGSGRGDEGLTSTLRVESSEKARLPSIVVAMDGAAHTDRTLAYWLARSEW